MHTPVTSSSDMSQKNSDQKSPCVNSELISLRVLNYGAKNPINTKSSIFFTALIYFTMIVVFTAVSYKVPFRKWENQALKKNVKTKMKMTCTYSTKVKNKKR